MVHGRSDNGSYCTFPCLTFDFGGRWRFFSPLFLAFQRPHQENSSEPAGPSPSDQCNNERTCTEDTWLPSTTECPSSSSPVNLVKGSHDKCNQDGQLADNSSSFDSCNHSTTGGSVCDLASFKSDTRVFPNRIEDVCDATKETARSSTKNPRKKRKKKKKSSMPSNALVPEVGPSNCHINSCEDGSFSTVEEIAESAGFTVPNHTGKDNSNDSNTALSGTSSSFLDTPSAIGDNAHVGSSPLLGKNEGISLESSNTAECSPSLEKEEGDVSLDNVTNPNSQGGHYVSKDINLADQNLAVGDSTTGGLHKKMSDTCDRLCSKVVSDVTDVKISRQHGGSSDIRLPASKRKNSRQHVRQCYLASNLSKKIITVSNTCVNRMFEVVRETYMYQIESEAVHLAIGGPLAVFEDFLHKATPVVGLLRSCQRCIACEERKMIGHSLCMHKIPNIPLRKFWRWYDKVGSYGIEVKVEGVQSGNRLGCKVKSYSAYFVPLLSAVQLFGHSRCSCSEADRILKRGSPSSGIPFPQHAKDRKNLPSTTSASPFNYSGGPELLFEYFEVEPPHLRPPIHNKIKELARGESSTNCRMYGDPSKLRNLRLHSVHPSSWYAVAWYPIYRIADGDFRAAFLAYHSFGHFIHRAASSDTLYGDTCIACPVAGLQYYNTQKECWFHLRASSSTIRPTGCDPIKPGELLKRRLQTLDASASVMSRASLLNGEQITNNRHPDYEFFLSRRL